MGKHPSSTSNLLIKSSTLLDTTDNYGEYNFDPNTIDPHLDDYFHTVLDHDEMYVRFDVIGDEIKYFLEHDRFSVNALRERCEWDPFEKHTP